MLTTNQVLQQGRYRIVQPLSGVDYEAFDDVHKTNVVLREIPFNMQKVMTASQTESLKNAFADEAKILMRIQHPAILKIHGWFSELNANYLVSEFTGGNFLSEMLKRSNKPFPLTEVSSWTDKLLEAISYLHNFAPPIVHRNIKPENLKLTSAGEIKLIISGLSEHTNTSNGKLNYLPLEQIWNGLDAASRNLILNSYDESAQRLLEKPADSSSDVYAIAATLYHFLTAKIPTDALERSIEVLEGKPDPLKSPHEINPQVPREISDVLMKALEIRRENRFHSAVIMRQVWRTAFVRLQERKTAPTVEAEEIILNIPSVAESNFEAERRQIEQERLKIETQQKRLEEERRIVEQEKLKIEAESKRQAEVFEQQKREAEAEKLKAAQIAEAEKLKVAQIAEAERLKSAQIVEAEKAETEKIEAEEEFPEIIEETALAQEEYFPEIIHETAPVAQTVEMGGFMESFTEPQKERKGFKSFAAVAAALLIFGGAGFGFWFFTSSKAAETNQTVSTSEKTPASSEQTTAPIKVETVTMSPQTENTPETNSSPVTSDSTEKVVNPINTTTAKTKPTSTPTPKPEAKKPTIATAKTPAPQKKPVTVEDLINDN